MMLITTSLNQDQLKQINNLIISCNNKQEMFDCLLCKVNLNAFHSLHMSNSYDNKKYDYSIIPLHVCQQRKTYHCQNGKVVLIEV